MPNFGQLPQCGTLLANATITQSGTSANASLPPAAGYRFFLALQTVSGTSPTLDVWLETSFDAVAGAGINYWTFAKFAQVTSSGLGRQISLRPYLSAGDVSLETQSACPAVADGTTGSGTVLVNGPINPTAIKVRYVVGGTTPSFQFQIGYIAVPQDYSD